MEFQITRTCDECKHTESRPLPEPIQSFEQFVEFEECRYMHDLCPNCGGTSFEYRDEDYAEACAHPKLMEEWGQNFGTCFTPQGQDDEIKIADEIHLELIFQFVQRRDILPDKRRVLLEALLVVIHDNTIRPDNKDDLKEDIDLEKGKRAVEFLANKQWLFDEIDDQPMWPYLKEAAYPQFGRAVPEEPPNT